jgi:hypothetical protein
LKSFQTIPLSLAKVLYMLFPSYKIVGELLKDSVITM